MPKCECHDNQCPCDHGTECRKTSDITLFRIDLGADTSPICMCSECADDAMESGVFATESEYAWA